MARLSVVTRRPQLPVSLGQSTANAAEFRTRPPRSPVRTVHCPSSGDHCPALQFIASTQPEPQSTRLQSSTSVTRTPLHLSPSAPVLGDASASQTHHERSPLPPPLAPAGGLTGPRDRSPYGRSRAGGPLAADELRGAQLPARRSGREAGAERATTVTHRSQGVNGAGRRSAGRSGLLKN